ncbi:hypothetical protein [Actinoplanes sp. NPDC048796]|uniref:hypothetical protein n=1 Tax=Actinoplanes sp. NPDC048796 TaxID=3155640 RepID=UPI0033FBE04A
MRKIRRTRQVAAGLVGLAVALSAGACGGEKNETTAAGEASPAGSVSAAQPGPEPTLQQSAGAAVGEAPAAKPSPSKSPPSLTPSEAARVKAAREFAQKHKVTIKKPLTPPTVQAEINDLKVSETGDVRKDREMLRVVTARSDLTGQRELGWVADEGEKVGDARCTQTVKLSNNPVARKRPTMVICWRTSATKSVYTVMINLDEKPSKTRSVAALDKAWAKLG